LVRHLLSNISDSLTIGMITCPIRQRSRFLKWVLMAFGQPFEGTSYVGLYKRFQDFLTHIRASGRRAVLVIDEAQNLGPEELEELRMLSNINEEEQIFQLVLVGQPELNEILNLPEMLQFSQRVSSDFFLKPLTLEDTFGYIEHRLHVVGGTPGLFTEDAKTMIFQVSGGVPRVINILSDMSLVYGYAGGVHSISADIVKGVTNDRRSYGIFSQQAKRPKGHGRANGLESGLTGLSS
jgi:hypothetical protein